MLSNIKKIVLKNKRLLKIILPIRKLYKDFCLYITTSLYFNKSLKSNIDKVYYLGIPAHSNLGDLAQGVCIRKWISKNYPDRLCIEIKTDALVNTSFSCLNNLKKYFRKEKDIIIFQSGYTTTDLGGYADIMHQAVIKALPDAKMLMMPQTIFFKSKERRDLCAKVYSTASNMLFLARDRVSFETAKSMFENININMYPDIVTTLIGQKNFEYDRDGIALCVRDDEEKYYTEDEIASFTERCKKHWKVDISDTTKKGFKDIVKNAEKYIKKEIATLAHYKVTITDRYHGTIFSLAAGTPVIIIKTTDHKVVTGAEWFKGVYDDYVYVAQDLEQAFELANEIMSKDLENSLTPYFLQAYYDKLLQLFM